MPSFALSDSGPQYKLLNLQQNKELIITPKPLDPTLVFQTLLSFPQLVRHVRYLISKAGGIELSLTDVAVILRQ